MAKYQIETPAGVFEIESDRDLGEAEILEAANQYAQQESDPRPEFMRGDPIPGVPGIGGEDVPVPERRIPEITPEPKTGGPTLGEMLSPSMTSAPKQTQNFPVPDEMGGYREMPFEVQESNPLTTVGELFGTGTRALGAAADPILPWDARGKNEAGERQSFTEAMADPETGLARPIREFMGDVVKKRFGQASDEERGYFKRVGDVLLSELAGAGYLAASMVDDPFVVGGAVAAKTPKMVSKAMDAMGAPGKKIGSGLQKGAEKIQNSIIKPRAMDEMAGYKTENVFKHGVQGPLDEVLAKSQTKIEGASKELRRLITEGKDQGATVNLYDAIGAVEQQIARNKAKYTPILGEYKAALKKLRAIAKDVSTTDGVNKIGKVDLLDAQQFKQGMGDMGAWEHVASSKKVSIPRDEGVLSQLASMVNLELKKAIEKAAPEGVAAQNKILSELIPVNRAATYRKIVADRNNVLSMSDMMGALATIGGGPKGLIFWAATRASKSGATSKALYGLAQKLQAARTPEEASRFASALKKLGVTSAEITAITEVNKASQQLPPINSIPFRQVAESDRTKSESQYTKR